ncbi:MAG TPA: hypothetical protein VGI33_20655 [Paenibacillus sp.]
MERLVSVKLNEELIHRIERSEITYMVDRMRAIQQRQGNPEGIELKEYNGAVAMTSRTMPWSQFNTIKGIGALIHNQCLPKTGCYADRSGEDGIVL